MPCLPIVFAVALLAALLGGCDSSLGVAPTKQGQAPVAQPSPAPEPVQVQTSVDNTRDVPVVVNEVRETPRVDIQPGGGIRVVGPAMVEYIDRNENNEQAPTLKRSDKGRAVGAGVASDGDDVKVEQVGQPSRVSLGGVDSAGVGGGSSQGEAGGSTTSATVKTDQLSVALGVLGGLAIIAGAVIAGVWKQWVAGITVAIGGVACIGMAVFAKEQPGLLIGGIVGLAVLGIAVVVWNSRGLTRVQTALGAVVGGVEESPAKAQVKASVGNYAAVQDLPVVREEVRRAKKREGFVA